MISGTHQPQFLRYSAGKWEALDKGIIIETPVSLTVNGQVWLTLMCTPIDLEALAVGFLFNEGVLKNKEEIELVQVCPQGDNVDVWLNHPVEQPKDWRRTSGCTGGATAVILEQMHPELKNGFVLTPGSIQTHIETLHENQDLYREVGGVHTSILSDGKHVVATGEDVGRHNSLDKIAGKCLLGDLQPSRKILVTTGRVSSEMIQKAARIGAPIVISRTSASSLSVMLAEKWGITLIGYARRDQFIVYTHAGRILQPAERVYTEILPQEA
jgi:FdhD protein